MSETRCHDVALLDVSALSPVTDFLVVASGTSGRQMRSVADELKDFGAQNRQPVYRVDGYDSAKWILIDFVDVVVHVFSNDARQYYDLENLWDDAKRVEWKQTPLANVVK